MIAASRFAAIGLVVLAMCAGCGRQTYLERLDETKRYFAYEDRLNQYLTRVAWAGKNFQLRVPKQFQPITSKAKEGEASQERDPRQPVFAEVELPGLQGAWQANFPLTGEEGKGDAWLYLCSNYDLLAKKSDEARASTFNGEVMQRIATAVGQPVPQIGKLPLYEVPPKTEEAFVDKRKYHVLSPGLPALHNDKPYRVRIFTYKKDNKQEKISAQISLIYVLPDNIVQASVLDRAIDMSLETLTVTRDKPPAAAAKGGKGGKAAKEKSGGGAF